MKAKLYRNAGSEAEPEWVDVGGEVISIEVTREPLRRRPWRCFPWHRWRLHRARMERWRLQCDRWERDLEKLIPEIDPIERTRMIYSLRWRTTGRRIS